MSKLMFNPEKDIKELEKYGFKKKYENCYEYIAEKNKDCDMCIKKKTMECPNSSLCYNTENKPYFKSKLDREE